MNITIPFARTAPARSIRATASSATIARPKRPNSAAAFIQAAFHDCLLGDRYDEPCSAAGHRRVGGASGRRTARAPGKAQRSEEHTSELQSLMRISYAVFCLKKKKTTNRVTL